MKTFISQFGGSFVLAVLFAGQACAVWVPSTELQPEQSQIEKNTSDREQIRPENPRGLVDRLEDDERRLSDVVKKLEEDEKQKKEMSEENRRLNK